MRSDAQLFCDLRYLTNSTKSSTVNFDGEVVLILPQPQSYLTSSAIRLYLRVIAFLELIDRRLRAHMYSAAFSEVMFLAIEISPFHTSVLGFGFRLGFFGPTEIISRSPPVACSAPVGLELANYDILCKYLRMSIVAILSEKLQILLLFEISAGPYAIISVTDQNVLLTNYKVTC